MMKLYKKVIQPYSEKINFYIALAIFFVIPIYTWWIPALINLWILTWVIQGNFKENFKSGKNKYVLFSFLAYFAFTAFSLIWSTNLKNGYSTVETQLSFVLVPILFFASNKIYKEKKEWFIYAFVSGTTLSGIFLMGRAFYRAFSISSGKLIFNPIVDCIWEKRNVFFSSEFSFFIHPTYMSMYVLFALILVLYIYKNFTKKTIKIILTCLTIFMGIIFIFLSSRSSYILSFILLIGAFFSFRKKVKLGILSLIIFFVCVIISLQYMNLGFRGLTINNLNKGEININFVEKIKKGFTFEEIKKTDPRIDIWNSAFEIIKQNPFFGVGVGDVKNELVKTYTKNGINWAASLKYGAHNQYLETFIGQGIIGLFMLIAIIVSILYISFKYKEKLIFLFVFIISFFIIFESMLNNFAGVIFITIFSTYFCFIYVKKQNSELNL